MSANMVTAFVNGRIFTARDEHEFVSAFAVRDGRIVAIGDAAARGADAVIDLQGRTVLPGFIDVHTHPSYVAMTLNAVPCTVPVVTDIPQMIAALRRHPNVGKGPTDWIEGFGYDESKLAERRAPTRRELDQVSTTQPVHVLRSDCHSGVCNTRALELAGITRDTPDPEGARIGRDEHGEPNGILQEHGANDLVMRAKTPPDYARHVAGIAATGPHYNARGIVAITEMMAHTHPFHHLDVFRDAARQGMPQQAALYFTWTGMQEHPIPDLTDEQRTGRVKFAGVKLFADGSISGRTAWVREPFRGSTECGYPTLTDADLQAAYEWAVRNRVQVAVHAMGDRAITHAIEFFADKAPWLGPDVPSVRLEHVTLLDEAHQRRMREATMTFGACMQIIFFFAEHDAYAANLTDRQYRAAYPVKSAYGRLPRFGLSSDAPATTWMDPDDVFVSIKAAVTRRAYNGAAIVPEEAITVPQAVRLYTARAATIAPFEGALGQIAPGFEASFIVLDRDLFTIDAAEIDRTQVEETWISGRQVFARR